MKINSENMHLYVEPNDEAETADDNPFNFFLVSEKHRWYTNGDNQIRVGEVQIEYPVPDKIGEDALAAAAIKELREKQQKVRADAHERCEKLDEQIKKLSRLTHQPTDIVIDDNVITEETYVSTEGQLADSDELPF